MSGDIELVKYLFLIDGIDPYAKTILFFGFYKNQFILKLTIYKTILHFAIDENRVDLVKFFIAMNIFDIKSTSIFQGISYLNFFYSTALHYTCGKGKLDIFKYLISLNKIDPKLKDIFNSLF